MSTNDKSETKFDLSIILNLHNETHFLKRTMLSLEEAVRFMGHHGLTTEIIAVLDRPLACTKEWIENYDFDDAFDSHQITIVDNGSLGLSRNSGIELARGEYIATADADDLVSYNMFHELYLTARSRGNLAIAMPQYLFAFGSSYHIVEYFGIEKVSKLGFFDYHPYVSRIFAHRSLFDKLRYQDVGLHTGFAYEDWHFNCEALALGYEFVIARNTVFFYRQRPGSLLKSANANSVRCIPASNYFEPRNFLSRCAYDYGRFLDEDVSRANPNKIRKELGENQMFMELVYAANKLDPAIDMGQLEAAHLFSNLDGYLEPGAAYFRIAKLLATERFTDIVLLPFLTTGGAEKYILEIIGRLSSLDPSRHFLILTGEKIVQHEWIDRLPDKSVFIDLHQECNDCADRHNAIDSITLRIIQTVGSEATVHIKSSVYGVRFCNKFISLLPNKFVYYRFSDPRMIHNEVEFVRGCNFQFLSENAEHLNAIITDNEFVRGKDVALLDTIAYRIHCLYAYCPNLVDPEDIDIKAKPALRLLWASRLDTEKRPELLMKLASRLYEQLPEINIDIFGSSVLNKFDTDQFDKYNNLNYKGPFSSFDTMPYQNYDAFLYTTNFDGMPNVVLEALSAALPVIAPDVGGIGEAVINRKTGLLLKNLTDDDALVDAYVDAIVSLYDKKTDFVTMRRKGLELITTRHSEEAYLAKLAEIFDIGIKKPQKEENVLAPLRVYSTEHLATQEM
jgi:glycosyltransferase involved in cell wall biosynthesis